MRKLLAAAAFLVLSTISGAAQYTPPPAGSLVVATCGAQAFPLLNNGKPNYAATTILQNGNLCTGASGGSGGSTTIIGPLGPSTTAAQSVATTFGAGTLLPAFAATPSFNESQINGATVPAGPGPSTSNTQRVTLSSDSPAPPAQKYTLVSGSNTTGTYTQANMVAGYYSVNSNATNYNGANVGFTYSQDGFNQTTVNFTSNTINSGATVYIAQGTSVSVAVTGGPPTGLTISLAGGPSAPTSTSLGASTAAIGQTGGFSYGPKFPTSALTTTAASHAAGTSIGGLQTVSTFRTTTNPTGLIAYMQVLSKGGSTTALTVYGFSKTPASTCTDNTAFALNTADSIIPGFPIVLTPAVIGAGTTVTMARQYGPFLASNQDTTATLNTYYCVVTNATQTPASTTDLVPSIGGAND